VTKPRSRRRGAELQQAILDAAWAELHEVGYAGLTIEAVAARASTSKPVIYRRWSSRAELVLAAWGHKVPATQGTIDTGALRSDLLTLFTRIARRADTMMSELIAGVVGETFRHPEVIALLRERLKASPLADTMRTIVERGVARGELPPIELPQRAASLPLDLIRIEAMTAGSPIPEEKIVELVDDIYFPMLRGLAGG
jgi:AcrR family transcriptional regulator